MVIFPKAKINLGLHVTEKRHDGFHNIETIFYPVGLSDALEIVVAEDGRKEDSLTVTGLPTGGNTENNLVIRAVNLLRGHYSFPVLKIHLHKIIPSGAGLGGGSSDAAFTIRAINKCFRLSVSSEMMRSYALELGSDCPFFIECLPSYATGRGEILRPVNEFLKGYYIVLVNPGISISTGKAYENCRPAIPEKSLPEIIKLPPSSWKDSLTNDFEDYVFRKHPQIGDIKRSLYNSGALYSSMSGSGSTVYGIFKEEPALPEKLKGLTVYRGIVE